MSKPKRDIVTIRLTPEHADLLMRNIDGWTDAGACEDGLTPEENEALDSAYDQISRQLRRRKQRSARQSSETPDV